MFLKISWGSVFTLFTYSVVSLCLLITIAPLPRSAVRDVGVERQARRHWERAVPHLPPGSAPLRVPFLFFVFGSLVTWSILTWQLVWSWSSFHQHLFTKIVMKPLRHFNGHKTELQCERPFSSLAKGFSGSGDISLNEKWHRWNMWVYFSSKGHHLLYSVG